MQQRKKRKFRFDFPIVGVGASAGGLEAFKKFFGTCPKEPGLAFVLIQHLDPTYRSQLPVLISQITEMPVYEVTKNVYIKKNHVYIAPPSKDIKVIKGKLIIQVRKKEVGPHLPIDHFFKSLAQDHGDKSIGVILSGTASDGTLGVEDIKAHGGITFAQDVASAGFAGMPSSAIQSGCVDFVLPPQKMAEELVWIAQHPYMRLRHPEKTKEMGELNEIFLMINRKMGIDFSNYKHSTIQRRIKRRMILKNISTLNEYVRYLQIHTTEVQRLGEDFLILVTDFFREPKAYEALRKEVFPKLIKNINKNQPIRLWVAGCSTGEEAYSLIIELLDYLKDTSLTSRVQLFATDISKEAISKARRAIFSPNIREKIPPARLKRYFKKVREGYQIHKSIRKMCVFAKHDLIKDPPFSRIDLISCRNVLIYMNPPLQEKVLSMFHHALSHNGYLFLGYSESIGILSNLYEALDRKNRLYSKKPPQNKSTSEIRYRPDIVSFLGKKERFTQGKETKRTRGKDVNEELMTAYEEIQTSNEELQSANEELITLNEEVQNKNVELITLGNDLRTTNFKLLETQELSDAIINTVREPLVILDSKLRIQSVNQTFYETFKVLEKNVKNKLIYSIGNGQWNIPQLRNLLEDVLIKKSFFNDYEVSHRFETIGPKIMLLNARKLRQKKGKKELILLAIEDITKKHELEMNIKNIEELKHKEKINSLVDFSAGIVHELNNPLSGCVGLLDIVLRDAPIKNDENYTILKEISGELVRSTTLVKDLLAFSKIGRSKEKMHKVDIHEIIGKSLVVINAKSKETKIQVQEEYGKNIPLIQGVKNQLEQVFINILSNAYDSVISKDTKGQITIKTDKTRDAIHVVVSDTGIGIKQKDISKVFMPFFTTGKHPAKGVGLGLTISKGIVEAHGGNIRIESKRGKETFVFISLPIRGGGTSG